MRGLRLLAVAGAIAAVNAVVTLALWLAGGDEFIPGLVGWGLRIMADNIIRDLAPALILMLPAFAVLAGRDRLTRWTAIGVGLIVGLTVSGLAAVALLKDVHTTPDLLVWVAVRSCVIGLAEAWAGWRMWVWLEQRARRDDLTRMF